MQRGVVAACCMLVIILDGRTAASSIQDGIKLCIQTVIPALFPFFLLSGIICSAFLGRTFGPLKYLGRLCKVPAGCESLILMGFLSGYPVGAQLITQAYKNGSISVNTARRMLGFCSNAGPAFLFGMCASLFSNKLLPWVLWGIHICGALTVAMVLPKEIDSRCTITSASVITVPQALRCAIINLSTVCGWIILFRLILGFCNRWFLWLIPVEIQVLVSGVLELSNGCVLLSQLPSEGMRFVLASLILSLGGVCVTMQTQSVTQGLGMGSYFPGKVIQALVSATVSCVLQPVLFSQSDRFMLPKPICHLLIALTVAVLYSVGRKKVVAFRGRMMYNIDNFF